MTTEPNPDLDDDDDDGLTDIDIIGLAKQPGMMDTIILFVGRERESGNLVQVAADHRPARDIIEALCDEDDVFVRCEGWQLANLPEDFPVLHPTRTPF